MADLSHLRDQILQLSVREALQLVGMMLSDAGVTRGDGAELNDVVLTGCGANKISVIKVLRELTSLGLKDAKDMAESAPQVVLARQSQSAAEAARIKLIEVGASVTIRPAE